MHLRSNAFERTILKIWSAWSVNAVKVIPQLTYLLHVDTMARATEDETSLHGLGEALSL